MATEIPPELKQAMPYLSKSQKYVQSGELVKALSLLLKGADEINHPSILYGYIADYYLQLGLDYRAIGYYEALNKERKLGVDTVINMTACYMKMNMYIEGIELCQETLVENQNNHELLFQLGNLYEQGHMYHKALDCFERTLQIDPSFQRATKGVLRVLFKLGRTDQLKSVLSNHVKLTDDENKLYQLMIDFTTNTEKNKEIQAAAKHLLSIYEKIENMEITIMSDHLVKRAREQRQEGNHFISICLLELAMKLRPDYKHYEFVYNEFGYSNPDLDDHITRTLVTGRLYDTIDDHIFEQSLQYIPRYNPHRFVPTRKQSNRFAIVEFNDIHPQLREQCKLIFDAVDNKKLIETLILCDLVLSYEPDLGEILRIKALTLCEMNRFEEAASVVYHFLSLKVDDENMIQIAMMIFQALDNQEKYRYYKKMLKYTGSTTETTTRSAFFGGVTTKTRSGSMQPVIRENNRLTHRFELPRNTWNNFMHAYAQLMRDELDFMAEAMSQTTVQYEPNFGEGRMLAATLKMMKGEFSEAKEHIEYILKIDKNYQPAIKKSQELEKLENGEEVHISLPIMEHKYSLSEDYYLHIHSHRVSKQSSQATIQRPRSYSSNNPSNHNENKENTIFGKKIPPWMLNKLETMAEISMQILGYVIGIGILAAAFWFGIFRYIF